MFHTTNYIKVIYTCIFLNCRTTNLEKYGMCQYTVLTKYL
nr:MAG TPA: hypothetical protein [Caudoviricetes sp.]